jgi:cyclopropane fatty-acyl-phospholipid synthase-like methyltransferase
MENYERYKTVSAESFEKKDVMHYLVRIPSDKKLLPMIDGIKGKKILDVGPGTGRYTTLLVKDNEVIGVDRNPHLCRAPIKIIEGDATQIAGLAGAASFDVVFSTWMTEYLNQEQLITFFRQAKKTLKDNGSLMSTIISKHGFGFLYITAAKLVKGISKYNYDKQRVCDMLREAGFNSVEIVNLSSWLGIPWAYVVIAK